MSTRTVVNQHFKRSIEATQRIQSHLYELKGLYEERYPGFAEGCDLLCQTALMLQEGIKEQFALLDTL